MLVMSSTMGLRLSQRRRAVVESTVAASATSHGPAAPPAAVARARCCATSCRPQPGDDRGFTQRTWAQRVNSG